MSVLRRVVGSGGHRLIRNDERAHNTPSREEGKIPSGVGAGGGVRRDGGEKIKNEKKKARAFVAYRVVFLCCCCAHTYIDVCTYLQYARIGFEGSSGGRYGVPAAAGRV